MPESAPEGPSRIVVEINEIPVNRPFTINRDLLVRAPQKTDMGFHIPAGTTITVTDRRSNDIDVWTVNGVNLMIGHAAAFKLSFPLELSIEE